jgi:hypothetical protein
MNVDYDMSRVIQHSVPRIPTQDQCDDCMSICGDLIDSVDKDGTFLNCIITGDKRQLFCGGCGCMCLWVSCNTVRQNHSPRNY